MKVLESWQKWLGKEYGALANNSKAAQRVIDALKSEQGRVKIIACVQERVHLHGSGPAPGIPECGQIVVEFSKVRNSGSEQSREGATGTQAEGTQSVEAGGVTPDGGVIPADAAQTGNLPTDGDAPSDQNELAMHIETAGDDGTSKKTDLLKAKLTSLVEFDKTRLDIHRDPQAFVAAVISSLIESSKLAIYIEASTSSIRVLILSIPQSSGPGIVLNRVY